MAKPQSLSSTGEGEYSVAFSREKLAVHHKHPLLLYFYAASCFGYAMTGLTTWTLTFREGWPSQYDQMFFVSTRNHAILMMLQSPLSYLSDVAYFFGSWPHFSERVGHAVLMCDRVMATANCINCCMTAICLKMNDGQRMVGLLFVAACLVTWPMAFRSRRAGDLKSYMIWHSLWHWLPCGIGSGWFWLTATTVLDERGLVGAGDGAGITSPHRLGFVGLMAATLVVWTIVDARLSRDKTGPTSLKNA